MYLDKIREEAKKRFMRNLIILAIIGLLWLMGVLYTIWYPRSLFAGVERTEICKVAEEGQHADAQLECSECGKAFFATRNCSVAYSTRVKEEVIL